MPAWRDRLSARHSLTTVISTPQRFRGAIITTLFK
jgi:hypothetical protein